MNPVWKKLPGFFFFIAAWAIPTLASGQSASDKIRPDLWAEMEAAPQAYHRAWLMLSRQVDVPALEADFHRRGASLEERSFELINALKAEAAATQGELLARMQGMPGLEGIRPVWIMNAIFLSATAEALLELSRHPAVAWIDVDSPVIFENEAATFSPAPLSLDNVENGLRAIGAPEMWAMGYTGYGRKALVVDTGQDPSHPALHNQFAYHHRPLSQSWRGGGTPLDCDNHGTHVTGTVLGLDRVNQDTIGVAFGAQWMGGVGLGGDCPGGVFVSGLTNMLQWAVDPDGNPATIDDRPDVINNSWASGSPSCGSFDIRQLYDALYAAGIAVVFSAGNDGPAPQTITAPKMNNWGLVRLFSVGNLNGNSPNLPIASSSSRGPSVCGGTGSLLIKPEVSAPGTNVRSCVPGGGYGNLSGTSMAAPHVSGAILLLKEAFPYLPGEELMLALYYTCTDLGPEGEDNDYGMGIINLPAAFQYLLAQGHEPAPPVTAANDISLLRVNTPEFSCGETVAPLLLLEHNGSDTVFSISLRLSAEGLPALMLEHNWEGVLLPGQRIEVAMPDFPLPAGEQVLVVEVIQANGQDDARMLDNRLKHAVRVLEEQPIGAIVAGDAPACANGQALVQSLYEGEGRVRWYDSPEGGALLGEGNSILLDVGDAPRTVYAQVLPLEHTGRPANTGGGVAQWSNAPQGLQFDVYSSCRLASVKVYAEEAGGRLLSLVFPDGSSVNRIVQVQTGEQRVELGMNLEAGEGYRIELKGGKPLQFSFGGNAYPYTIPNVLSIRRSTAGTLQYYYFYDWAVEYDYFCGRSPVEVGVAPSLTPLTAAFSPADVAIDLASGNNEVSFTDQSEGAVAWFWNFGDGLSSTEQNPVHAYGDTGTYQVSLTVLGPEGCSHSTTGSVQVTESMISSVQPPAGSEEWRVFPNPAQDAVYISPSAIRPATALFVLSDMLGRPALVQKRELAGRETVELSLSGLPAGVYLLVVETEGGRFARRIVKN